MKLTCRRRPAISEVIGTVLVTAMTLVAGAAIWGYVNGQAGVASQAYGQSVGNSVQYLEEKFAVIDMQIANVTCPGGIGTCGSFTLWIYNTGKIQLTLEQVRVYDASKNWNLDLLYNYVTSGGSVTNQVTDLTAGASKCSIQASTYEKPAVGGSLSYFAPISNTTEIQLIVPPTTATPLGSTCPSFGQLAHTTPYFAVVAGSYGNSYTYSQIG
ncbi:MAG: hypothetical protein JRN57_01875 [Nitrososphaerota archaeon]|nr:hypothetical protein [Nitrososphaerota archaeon]